ncbi:hypothetical protein HF882_06280 [Victivallis vadensis]|uniref:Alpha-1,2-mannosidase n=1 Tax=Victivallis vadensis TaxID=172901 RepID=A0A848AY71_9BACT|nr:GH92 family glycosyl hydrolase [Victivallis vadensis]NMD86189.1 hypothetical protein [Victivallis vadensis]
MKNTFFSYVNPQIGVDRGNCLIGPYRPFSLVRLGPDCEIPHHTTTGYHSNSPVIGFSHTHVSGTGGVSRYGNIRVMPFTGIPLYHDAPPFFQVPWGRRSDAMLSREQTAVGYYAARQDFFGINLELTSTEHVGVHRYHFDDGREAWIFLDLGACIQALHTMPGEICPFEHWEQNPRSDGGFLEMSDCRTVRGRADLRGGWGNSMPYSVYFQMEFDQEIRCAEFANAGGMVPGGVMKLVSGKNCAGIFCFGKINELNIRVGISLVSIANAEASLRRESDGRDFDQIRQESEAQWEQLFADFEVIGGSFEERTLFYTMLYRLHCMPTDLGVDQENPFWKTGRRAFTDYYCLWDSVRNSNSFFLLFNPELARDFLNNLIEIAEHSGGWLSDAYIANRHAYQQGACSADIIFAEAAGKELTGVDYRRAFQLICFNHETNSPAPQVTGRARRDWNEIGYLSTRIRKGCVSRHIEYSFCDWCTARLAEFLDEPELCERYDRLARQVWNLWEPERGMFAPRNPDGQFLPQSDYWQISHTESHNDLACCESPIATWCLNVFHDFPGLIERMGGRDAFRKHLDRLFDSGIWFLKETMAHIPHLYTLIGEPERSAEHVRYALRSQYRPTPDGLRDDEDFGCQSSWYLWNAIGLYPLIGHSIYLLSPPLFSYCRLKTGTGHIIIKTNRSAGSDYIIGLRCNGRELDRAWLHHEELQGECVLEFLLAAQPEQWGKRTLPFVLTAAPML